MKGVNHMVVSLKDLKFNRQNIEWVLLIISSGLLGVWAVKETIALRNILLVCGAVLSIYYISLGFKEGWLKKRFSFWKLLPLFLLAFVFIWVMTHYFLFSLDPKAQLDELRSTWLRSLLAAIVGLGTGLAMRNHPERLAILWIGILISFFVLLSQYIPRALTQQKLLVPDYDYYLFHLKHNTVLTGTVLLAGSHGALFDYFRLNPHPPLIKTTWRLVFNWLVSSVVVLWSFVYIVNARNGIGLSLILYTLWFFCVASYLFMSKNRFGHNIWKNIAGLVIGLLVIVFFTVAQTKVNAGWTSLKNDAKIAIQLDRYPHWANSGLMGFPQDDTGRILTIASNNYERIAWALAGTRAIIDYPMGVGILAYPFSRHPSAPAKMLEGSNIKGIATHSGWVELGLAFGLPILSLIFLAIAIIFIICILDKFPARMTVLSFLVLIMCLYTTGEIAIDHGLEILFYLLFLLASLSLVFSKNSNLGRTIN
jgi:hypothetical protein